MCANKLETGRIDQAVFDVLDVTPVAIFREDLQAGYRLAPKDCYTSDI